MRELYLFRHGESHEDNLTPNGRAQVRLACWRWMREGSIGEVAVFHSPTKRTKDSAEIITEEIGVPSVERVELAIGNAHNTDTHRAFARMLGRRPESIIVLIGHDETRCVLEEIVRQHFGGSATSPEVPLGGLLCFTEEGGYKLI